MWRYSLFNVKKMMEYREAHAIDSFHVVFTLSVRFGSSLLAKKKKGRTACTYTGVDERAEKGRQWLEFINDTVPVYIERERKLIKKKNLRNEKDYY